MEKKDKDEDNDQVIEKQPEKKSAEVKLGDLDASKHSKFVQDAVNQANKVRIIF